MKIAANDLIAVAGKAVLRSDVAVNAEMIARAKTPVTKDVADAVVKHGAEAADIVYTPEVLAALNRVNPAVYRRPYAVETLQNIEKIIAALERTAENSERKRMLIAAEEIYAPGKSEPLIAFGEPVTADRIAAVKQSAATPKTIAYRPSEVGIIVLIDLRPRGDDYLKRFYKNSDLVTTLVGRKNDAASRIVISPDMHAATDVHVIDNCEELVAAYRDTNARLVMVGEALSPEYKRALGEIKKYDRFARFMLAVNIDHTQTNEFLRQVALNYHRDPWLRTL